MSEPLLDVRGLGVGFQTDDGLLTAVDDVSFSLERGRTLGLVGESGCGKSVTARALMRLLEHPSGRVLRGEVRLDGRDLLQLPIEAMRQVRGREIAMIFQEPMTALNPVHRVGRQIVENLLLHETLSPQAALRRAVELLDWVGIPAPDRRIDEYPHQLSGGMRQRVMIAMALSCNPKVLIADEPTTALDVTVQAQILDLIRRLQKQTGMAVLLITHDLGVVAETCDEVAVMYAGRLVERAEVHELFAHPLHAYTQGLLASIPQPGATPKTPLRTIPGQVPGLAAFPSGCRFAERSGHTHSELQTTVRPPFVELRPSHLVENCPLCVGDSAARTTEPTRLTADENAPTPRSRIAQDSWQAALAELAGSPSPGGPPQSRTARRAERLRQLECLRQWAERNGLLISPDSLGELQDEASEHRVYYDPQSGDAVKTTLPGRCGNAFPEGGFDAALPEEYCQRWLAYNAFFGDDVLLAGVLATDDGISLVIRQRWIEGDRPDKDQIHAWMDTLGFTQAPNLRDYYRLDDATAVLDAHEDNFILASGNALVPIDVHVLPLDADLRRALCL